MGNSDLYKKLILFKRNEIDASEISDQLIKTVKSNGIVLLDFDTEEYFNLIMSDNSLSKNYVTYAIGSNYYRHYDYFMYDSWRAQEDWKEGYIYRDFDTENRELIEKILRMVGVKIDEIVEEDFTRILEDHFSKYTDDIWQEYQTLVDDAHLEFVREDAYKSYCNVLFDLEIYYVNKNKCFDKYVTTVDNLIYLYESLSTTYGEKYNNSDLFKMLKKTLQDKDMEIDDDIYEDAFNHWYSYFDSAEFNRISKNKLEQILEQIEENSENIEDYKEIMSNLTKFRFSQWHSLPKNTKMLFKINFVSPSTKLINVDLKSSDNKYKKTVDIPYDRFMLLLYHPELFDLTQS